MNLIVSEKLFFNFYDFIVPKNYLTVGYVLFHTGNGRAFFIKKRGVSEPKKPIGISGPKQTNKQKKRIEIME